jgi:signal transduction histidine kinase
VAREQLDPVLWPVVHAAALRGEKVVSISRIVFCSLVLLRFLLVERTGQLAPYLLNIPALGMAIGYSVWLLVRMRAGRATYGMLALSVAVDTVGCFASLMQTVLWPSEGAAYGGLLTTPDISALLLIVYCAGFRVWPRIALLGAVLNLIAYFGIVLAEHLRYGDRLDYGFAEVAMFLFVLVSVMVLSVGTARRTLALVAQAATATRQVDRAREKLADLAREHHDARSVISAATLSSDMMMRALEHPTDVRRHAERLREDLELAKRHLGEMGEKAYFETLALANAERVETARVLREAKKSLELRFPELAIDADLSAAADVRVIGGEASLTRILYNLVRNAKEGNGHAGASRVTLSATSTSAGVELVLDDDGPGFDATSASTKHEGMGLGLTMTTELVERSGGSLHLENRPRGGARVRLWLPAA